MNRSAKIYFHEQFAGNLEELDDGYVFTYAQEYIDGNNIGAISKHFPLQVNPFKSKVMFAFFDGLIPEGWLLAIAEKNWKLNTRDRFGLLLACCEDCIGAVSVRA